MSESDLACGNTTLCANGTESGILHSAEGAIKYSFREGDPCTCCLCRYYKNKGYAQVQ